MRHLFTQSYSPETSLPYYWPARLISDFANPLFIPPLVLALMGWITRISSADFRLMTFLSLIFYTLIPFSFTLFMVKSGYLQSMDLPNRKKRGRLYKYSIISNLVCSVLLVSFFHSTHPFLAIVAVVFFFNPLFGYILNMRWKISIHAAALSMAGTIFFILFWGAPLPYDKTAGILSLIILLLILPLMLWSRSYLRLHSLSELFGGIGAGVILTTLEISIMLRLW